MPTGHDRLADSLTFACLLAALLDGAAMARQAPLTTIEPSPPGAITVDLLAEPMGDWHVPSPVSEQFQRRNGILTLPASADWTLLPGRFGDVAWHLEFRLSSDRTFAGMLLHGFLPDPSGSVRAGYQVWVSDPDHPVGTIVSATGGTTCGGKPDAETFENAWTDSGQWQSLDIKAEDDRLLVALNGTRVFDCEGGVSSPGIIGLRASGGTVRWRNLRLTHTPPRPWSDYGVLRPGGDVSMPRVLEEARPNYTGDAMSRRVEGVVVVECIVDERGSVERCRVMSGLDPGLDAEAVRAAMKWRFEPARRADAPVRVLVSLELTFTLRR